MKGQVFGRMLAFLRDKAKKKEPAATIRTRPKRGKYKKPHAPSGERKANWEVDRAKRIQKMIDLAKTVKALLKDYLPTEIEEMVAVMASTS
jgi:hypothetical protein